MLSMAPTGHVELGIFGLVGVAAWLSATWLLGSAIYWALWSLASSIIAGLELIERNTHNGVVGIAGFVLFSVATAIKLSAIH